MPHWPSLDACSRLLGHMQPFTRAHASAIEKGLEIADKVAVVLGSHDAPRTARNPFTTEERIKMITMTFPDAVGEGRIRFVPQVDHTYNMDRWIAAVYTGVTTVATTPFTPNPVKIGLIGHSKDASSFYLRAFPRWESVDIPEVVSNKTRVDATTVRERLFKGGESIYGLVPLPVDDWLQREWKESDAFEEMKAEHDFILDYKRQWSVAPYPPTFFCADAVVVQSGHILLVKRRAAPGKGLWAIPGGFINQKETAFDASIRELREETRIKVPPSVLRGCATERKVYDDPWRSQRGRTITVAQKFNLRENGLPEVKGADDAEKARWIPLGDVHRSMMFEDHYDIIEDMVGI